MGVLDSIGNTPLVKLESLNPDPRVTVLAKLEGNNPGGSVKDRIALAMVGAALDYKVVHTMPERVSTVTSPLHCHRSSSSGLFFRTSHHRSATPA